jgi:hypothetical protein
MHKLFYYLFIPILSYVLLSCVDTLEDERLVYSNDFSKLNLENFENARLFIYEKEIICGNYNNEEVAVTIKDLPTHNVLRVKIDLLIHDSWDGNPDDGIGGPDIWYMRADNQELIRTTFSNSPCVSTYCIHQSYPNDFFRQNSPKTGATRTNLPGLCFYGGLKNNTTKYQISRLVSHHADSVRLVFGDELIQVNADFPICDESWSIAKIEVSALTIK